MKSSLHLKNSIKSVAIGSFDGVHIAHIKLIERAESVVVIERGDAVLTPGWKRSLYTKKPTFFYLLEKIKHLSPKEFIQMLNRDFPNLEKIVVGYDFAFGKGKAGGIDTLKKHFRGTIEVIDEVKLDGISIHSRVIREYIKSNNIEVANRMLGRYYAIDGEHKKGQGRGAKEMVATINLKVINYTLPKGVFAVNAKINNNFYKAIAFLGNRLTTDGNFCVEVHILDSFSEKIRGRVWIEFIRFIRENRKFDTIFMLKKQILDDIKRAKEILIKH